jgi:hypothetical protein
LNFRRIFWTRKKDFFLAKEKVPDELIFDIFSGFKFQLQIVVLVLELLLMTSIECSVCTSPPSKIDNELFFIFFIVPLTSGVESESVSSLCGLCALLLSTGASRLQNNVMIRTISSFTDFREKAKNSLNYRLL